MFHWLADTLSRTYAAKDNVLVHSNNLVGPFTCLNPIEKCLVSWDGAIPENRVLK